MLVVNAGARRRFVAAFVAFAVVAVCGRLVYLERWLVDNDNYITLSSFFASAGHDDYQRTARRYHEALIAACPAGDARCVAYSGALFGEQTYSRPITSFFGARLVNTASLGSTDEFFAAITRVTVSHVALSAVLAVVLALCFLGALPAQVATFLAAALAIFGVSTIWLPEQTPLASVQPLLGVGPWGAIAVVAVALVAFGVARAAGRPSAPASTGQRSVRLALLCGCGAVCLLVLRALAYYGFPELYFARPIFGSQVGLAILILSLAGLAIFLVATRAAIRVAGASPHMAWVVLFLLFALVTPGENFFVTAFHVTARGHIYLLAAPILVYVALHPNGRALWLLPALALFNVPIAGLLFACIAVTEVVTSLRRRSVSLALVLSVACFIAAGIHTALTGGNPVITSEVAGAGSIFSRLDPLMFLPGVAVLAVLGIAGYVAWRMPDPAGDFLLRALALAALLAGAGQLGFALRAAGFDIVDPVAFNYILLSYYLGPAVCTAGLFLVMLALSAHPRTDARPTLALNGHVLALITAAVLALAAARAGSQVNRPADPLPAIARAALTMVTGTSSVSIDPAVVEAAAPGDRYLLGRNAGDAITMMSVLKMKARSAAGVLDVGNVSIVPVGSPGSDR